MLVDCGKSVCLSICLNAKQLAMFLFTGLLCGTPSAPARVCVLRSCFIHGWHVPRAREGGAWGCAHGVRDTLRDVGLG